jgi:cysteine-rich repeat protein
MRRLQLVPVMAITLFALAGVAHAKKFPPCPSGRFVVSPADALQFGNPPPALETLSIVGGTQVVLPDCGPAPTKLKGGKKATTLTARWAQCGTFSKIRLKAKIPSPACNTLQGTIKAKKTAAKPFTAALSTCGDGSFDGEGGEECDATASGGDAACPGACGTVGTPTACLCPLATTTTTIPVIPVCGDCTVEPGETCDDCNTMDGDNCPSTCFIAGCTPVAGTSRTASVKYTPPAGTTVGGLGLFVDYPEAQVRKPMIHLSSGVSGVVHDRDYGLTEELIDTAGTGFPGDPGALFQMNFQDCQGATPPLATDFTCTVEDASDEIGNVLDPSTISCTVTIP